MAMDSLSIGMISYLFVMLAVSIIGNTSTIIVILKYRELRSTANYLILNLAVADLLLSLVGTPTRFTHLFGHQPSLEMCKASLFFGLLFFHASVFGLVLVSLDRYICITVPLHYQTHIVKRKSMILVIVCWVFAFLLAILPYVEWEDIQTDQEYDFSCRYGSIMSENYIIFLVVVTEFLAALIMMTLYLRIFIVAASHAREIAKLERTYSSQRELDSVSSYSIDLHDNKSAVCRTVSNDSERYLTVCQDNNLKQTNKITTSKGKCTAVESIIRFLCKNNRVKPSNTIHRQDPGVFVITKDEESQTGYNNLGFESALSTNNGNGVVTSNGTDKRYLSAHPQRNPRKSPNLRAKSRISIDDDSVFGDNISTISTATTTTVKKKKKRLRKGRLSFTKEYKAAKLIAAVVGLFLICTIPIAVLDVLATARISAPYWVIVLAVCLVYTNPAVNACLYAIAKREFRYSYVRLWTCGKVVSKRRLHEVSHQY